MTIAVAALGVAACGSPVDVPDNTNTATVSIAGQGTAIYPILCTQRNWLWTIDTLPDSPGFTAMVQTGATVLPKVIRINDLHGFTGSAAGENLADTEADLAGSTFTMTGVAHGSFADRPVQDASVEYEITARC